MKVIERKNELMLISAVLLVLLFVFVLALSKSKTSQPSDSEDLEITRILNVSQSNDDSAIDKDLNETDLKNLDKEISEIESELGSSY